MKKKNISWICYLLLFGFILILTMNGCKNSDDNIKKNKNNNNKTHTGQFVTDIDSNVYRTVVIGKQTWMAENLKATHYRNGDPIPNVIDPKPWCNLKKGAYCDYDNSTNISSIYGKLYNKYAVEDSRNIAPTGWHVPTHAEWVILQEYLGGEAWAGGKLKETYTIHWNSPNKGATNETSFTALPGGYRDCYGNFHNLGSEGYWWTSSQGNKGMAGCWEMNFNYSWLTNSGFCIHGGLSVRCVKD